MITFAIMQSLATTNFWFPLFAIAWAIGFFILAVFAIMAGRRFIALRQPYDPIEYSFGDPFFTPKNTEEYKKSLGFLFTEYEQPAVEEARIRLLSLMLGLGLWVGLVGIVGGVLVLILTRTQ